MGSLDLFPSSQVIGVFRGFREGGLEFHADLVLPYRSEFQSIPMHGQFVLVQLESPDEAVLGRITSLSSEGKLSSPAGEEYNIRAVRERREVPDDLREDYLRYRVNIRVLGVLRNTGSRPTFVPSHRRLPHLGRPVAFPSGEVLREIAGHNNDGAEIGHFALGEYIYGQRKDAMTLEPWMQFRIPEVTARFAVENLVSRRTFVFARAGFGKSNLVKLLFSKLYDQTPMVPKRAGRMAPVGTVIFDPDGEYFWPDDKGRPGLADVPALKDQLVVFTPRRNPSEYYQSFVAGGIKLDVRRLRPSDVIAIALGPDKQDQQNVRKLAGLSPAKWERLVDLIDKHSNQADLKEIATLLSLEERQDVEALAARANMTTIVRSLHDKSSQMMDMLLESLSEGKLCVVDVSQMRGGPALILSGLILRRIFDRNQEEFTKADSRTIPTIAVIEEAQAVLNERASSSEPYVAWVKEGRKYDLGALLITQQPGSIPTEVLSQGDNWFIFHLLSAGDLANVHRSNAHFSDDLLSVLLNEPIPGHCVFWSSVGGTSYPISVRAFSFEAMFTMLDPGYSGEAADTYAARLRVRYDQALQLTVSARSPRANGRRRPTDSMAPLFGEDEVDILETDFPENEGPDAKAIIESRAIVGFRNDTKTIDRLRSDEGMAWRGVMAALERHLPDTLDGRQELAYQLVPRALDEVFGPQNQAWRTYKNDRDITYVKAIG